MLNLRTDSRGIIFQVYVQPKASKNEIAGVHDDALKIRLTAPPVEGEANKMLVKYLAKRLSVPKSRLEIVSGQTGRRKQVLLQYSTGESEEKEALKLKKAVEELVSQQ